MRVTVRIPVKGTWVADIRIPDDAVDNIVGFLEDNPEYVEDIEANGELEDWNCELIDAQIDAS